MQKDYMVGEFANAVERLSEQQLKYLHKFHEFLSEEEYQKLSEYLQSLNLNITDDSDKVIALLKSFDDKSIL